MSSLSRYIDVIVEPTFEDFKKNRGSVRHAFLACVAIFHGIDRASEEMSVSRGNLRKEWRKTFEFMLVDLVAHHFKHVQSDDERMSGRWPGIPISHPLGLSVTGDTMELRNMFFVIRDAVRFLRTQAEAIKFGAPSAPRSRRR